MPEEEEDIFEVWKEYGYKHGQKAADVNAEGIKKAKTEDEVSEMMSDITDNWVQSDWWANTVLPQAKKDAEGDEDLAQEILDTFDEAAYEGFMDRAEEINPEIE